MYKHSIEARSHYHCRRGKAIIITYSESVTLALVILHAMRMRSNMLLSVACMGLPDVCTLSHKREDFRKGGGKLLNIKYILIFSPNLV